jgi:hypothetical protein
MTNYHYRKYEGAPHSEQRKLPAPTPSKLAPRKPRKYVEKIGVSSLWRFRPKRQIKWWELDRSPSFICPHIGKPVSDFNMRNCAEHVIRRLKSDLMQDKQTGLFWVEAQAHGKQMSPEFSNYECCINWLLYYGLKKGWLHVEGRWTREYTWKGVHYPSKKVFGLGRH